MRVHVFLFLLVDINAYVCFLSVHPCAPSTCVSGTYICECTVLLVALCVTAVKIDVVSIKGSGNGIAHSLIRQSLLITVNQIREQEFKNEVNDTERNKQRWEEEEGHKEG